MTYTAPDPSAFLMGGGGAPAAKFPEIGAKIDGTVVSTEVAQQTDLDGNPATWDDGNPKWQLVVTLATDERDADIEDDDGTRRLFVKGSKKVPTSLIGSVQKALKDAGVNNLAAGGRLQLAYTGDGEATKRGFTPPKQYVAKYTPPSPTAASDDIFDD